ncbi:MAG TPA: response regulator transcription factor [Cyclobacteriaceae bacterium]
MKILVCDDDEALISMIRFKITRDNMGEIVKAMDGREAMKLLKDNEFDLIITDINMPFHSGLEITVYVREELKRTTPIIMLSADGPEDTVLQALSLGVNDFMTKPFSPADLSVRIKRLVEKKA